MTPGARPLGYCTNVHPAQSVEELLAGLDRYTVPVARRVGRPIAAGLWLARPVATELLAGPHGPAQLSEALRARSLCTYTLNAFPYGDFHARQVKDRVYLPDWTTAERCDYTIDCALILAEMLPPGEAGSISTLPLGFKQHEREGLIERSAERLIDCALELARIEQTRGRTIRLAIEPEPFCQIETTDEAIAFFERLWQRAAQRGVERVAREHLGLCYDVCHQAVEFEDPAGSIARLDAEGIRINKIQLSCAIEIERPGERPEALDELRTFVEPRYLHQVFARGADGSIFRHVDLSTEFLDRLPSEFRAAETWRVHFHVPVDAEQMGLLGTTRFALEPTLRAAGRLAYTPDVEVETYTWTVMPGEAIDLPQAIARELAATRSLLEPAAD